MQLRNDLAFDHALSWSTHGKKRLSLHRSFNGSKTVRITKEERVEVMEGYRWGYESELGFSPDATVWLKTADDDRALLHIAPPKDP